MQALSTRQPFVLASGSQGPHVYPRIRHFHFSHILQLMSGQPRGLLCSRGGTAWLHPHVFPPPDFWVLPPSPGVPRGAALLRLGSAQAVGGTIWDHLVFSKEEGRCWLCLVCAVSDVDMDTKGSGWGERVSHGSGWVLWGTEGSWGQSSRGSSHGVLGLCCPGGPCPSTAPAPSYTLWLYGGFKTNF